MVVEYIQSILLIIAAFLVALLLVGCKSEPKYYSPDTSISSPNFNQEQYVWEDFYFTTNRVNGVK